MRSSPGVISACRLSLRRIFRKNVVRVILMLFIILNTMEVLSITHRLSISEADAHWPVPPSKLNERVYIVSIHWNNEEVLPEWNKALVSVVRALGPENVFVSVFESGSWDSSKKLLRGLDKELASLSVERNITLDRTTHKDVIKAPPVPGEGWVRTPQGKTELRRIPYLAKLRNLSLEPLQNLQKQGKTFTKVLFLNDVIFTTKDVITLLRTNDGAYSAACSLDYAHPPKYYDTFALRDSEGHETVMQTWPYFRSRTSRHALKANKPVPVKSCWNGMVAMEAEAFARGDLRFRGVSDSLAARHVEGSECCLIHADNPLSGPVFVNPRVRVGYDRESYNGIHGDAWASTWNVFIGLWSNRFRRWFTTPWFKENVIKRRVKKWQEEGGSAGDVGEGLSEKGVFCLINEMQVLRANGWAHV